MKKDGNKKKKVTLFLDTDTLIILELVGNNVIGSANKSGAVRYLAKEYEKNKRNKEISKVDGKLWTTRGIQGRRL